MSTPSESIADVIARFKVETGDAPTRVEVGPGISNALAKELAGMTYTVKTFAVENGQRRSVRSKHCSLHGVLMVPVEEPGIRARRCAEDAIEEAECPLLVAAHTEAQLRRFSDTFKIPREEVMRVSSSDHLRGYFRGRHLFLLPDWQESVRQWHGSDELWDVALAHEMKIFNVAEHEVLGISAEEYRSRVDENRRWRAGLRT